MIDDLALGRILSKLTQGWMKGTERSSGFRDYIFALLMLTLITVAAAVWAPTPFISNVLVGICVTGWSAFFVLFGIKAFADPNFCRSERHVERMAIERNRALQKGDELPRVIDAEPEVRNPATLPPPDSSDTSPRTSQ